MSKLYDLIAEQPKVAEGILREFYGLPTPNPSGEMDSVKKTEEPSEEYIDLSSFL